MKRSAQNDALRPSRVRVLLAAVVVGGGLDTERTHQISCLPGDVAIGGGYTAHHDLITIQSVPIMTGSTATGWKATFHNTTSNDDLGVSVWVSCADLP